MSASKICIEASPVVPCDGAEREDLPDVLRPTLGPFPLGNNNPAESFPRNNELRVAALTQGGWDHWVCPVCNTPEAVLHFGGPPIDASEHKWQVWALPMWCEWGHRFIVELRSGKGALWVRVEPKPDWNPELDKDGSVEP